jgi:DNA repair photolyase
VTAGSRGDAPGGPFVPRSILTPTGGFLKSGYTHSLNPSLGCAFGKTLCGAFCYAQHNQWITRGRPWRLYARKLEVPELYRRDAARVRKKGRPLRIFLSSSTEPYPPEERRLGQMRRLLEAMRDEPPDLLTLQTHGDLVVRDLDLLRALGEACRVRVSVTIETDRERLPGLPPPPVSVARRLEALARVRAAGIPCQAALAPLLPLENPAAFAVRLDEVADRVVLDHYLLGDGSAGVRTSNTCLPGVLQEHGFGEWNTLEPFERTRALFERILGAGRVLISEAGFNAP